MNARTFLSSIRRRTIPLALAAGLLLGFFAAPPPLHAQSVPPLLNYQGRVVVNGVNFNSTGYFKFALVSATGTTTYWSNDGTSSGGSEPTAAVALPVSNGLYSVLLGDTALANMTAALPASVFAGHSDVRLRVWFNDGPNGSSGSHGSQLLTPDQRIAAVGYALMAGSVAPGAITGAMIAPGAVTSTQLSSPLQLSSATGSGGSTLSGTNSADGGVGISGVSTSTSSSAGIGVLGDGGDNGTGVSGIAKGNAANAVSGTSTGTGGTGVRAIATGSGVNGVWATATGNYAYGVFANASGTNSQAGYFQGDVTVTGTLSKSGGSFRIDHPLDPANKYLSHSFVESPDMMNIYNGNVVLGDAGEAVVTLPEWFGALNREFRYQLTCLGGFAPVYVAEEIAGNHFKIAGGKPGLKVSWQVTGVRQDTWANAHRIPVEEDKTDRERGSYLHPDLFGQPAEKSVESVRRPEGMRALKAPATPGEPATPAASR